MVHPSLEAKLKAKSKKRKVLGDQPLAGKPAKPVKPAKVINQVVYSDSESEEAPEEEVEVVELPKDALSTYDVGNAEFDPPFELESIPRGLRDRMVAVAPVLLGRNAVYNDAFFRDCVGLCSRGPTVDEVSKVYTEI